MNTPIKFTPIYKERVWGGRSLETLYNRDLPCENTPYGESWEICDRDGDQTIVKSGRFAGKSLNQLWNQYREELFGASLPNSARFPLLIKILDAQTDLSIQVHPPAKIASELGGEPKTEMWYITDCKPGAKIYVGLKENISRQDFIRALNNGSVDSCIHEIETKQDDSVQLNSGRLHAIGAGHVIFEIQQNSDTTYRVFDWNRLGLDGKPRDLHVKESLASIDFDDVCPSLEPQNNNVVATCEFYDVVKKNLSIGDELTTVDKNKFSIISVISGKLESQDGDTYQAGDFIMLPRLCSALTVRDDVIYLEITLP